MNDANYIVRPPRPAGPSPDDDQPVCRLTADMLLEPPTTRRTDFEQGMSCLPRLTITLIIVNTMIFGWEVSTGALDNAGNLVRAGALDQQAIVRGEAWRLVSNIFLHAGPDHLMGNCLALFILGMACEHAFGVVRTLGIYVLSGIAGSLLSVAIEPRPTVGASGAIFGILGCVMVFLYRYRHQFAVRDGRIGFVLAVWALYQLGTGFLNPLVANYAHVGGLIGGAAIGLVWRPTLVAPEDPLKTAELSRL